MREIWRTPGATSPPTQPYVLVMTALIVLNFSFLTGFWWSVIPLVGWSVVLALHYLYLRRIGKADADRRHGPSGGP